MKKTLPWARLVWVATVFHASMVEAAFAPLVIGMVPNTLPLAIVLDGLAVPPGPSDPALIALLAQLNTLTSSGAALQSSLETLLPPINSALVQESRAGMNSMFSSIEYRIETLTHLKALGAESYSIYRGPQYSGQNYGDGDGAASVTGVWFEVYGSLLNQKFYKNVYGYNGDVVGYALGVDWGGPECVVVGVALSYTNAHTVESSAQGNILDMNGVQGTVYTWFEPFPSVFVDTMFGFSSNKYESRRNIGVGVLNTSAFADFYGLQYALQSDLGYAFTYDYFIVAPIGRFKYSYLAINNYTEEGAGGVGLSVENNSLSELIGGIGIKILGDKKYSQARYVPEASIMILYDFDGDGQETSSNFVGGGGIFAIEGPRPSHTLYLLGLGITAYTYDNYSFEIKYDLEIGNRYHFYSNSAYMQLRGEWG